MTTRRFMQLLEDQLEPPAPTSEASPSMVVPRPIKLRREALIPDDETGLLDTLVTGAVPKPPQAPRGR